MGRKAIVARIESLVTPLLHDSGYRMALDPSKGVLGGSRPLRLWAPSEPIQLDGFALVEVLAITEDGVIEDATGGGCITGTWDCYPVEDLKALLGAVERALA